MGQEIVYCNHCQSQIRSSDFAQGASVRVDHHSYCSRCAPAVLRDLPPEKIQEVRRFAAGALKTTTPRGHTASTAGIPAPSTTKTRIPQAVRSSGHGKALSVAFTAVAVLVVGLVVARSGGKPEPESVPPRPADPVASRPPRPTPIPDKPPPAPLPPAVPAPVELPPLAPRPKPQELSRDPKRQAESQEALRAAREARTLRPREFDRNFELAQKAVWASEGMPWAAEATRELDACRKQLTEFFDAELVALDKEIRASLEKEDFKTALDAIANAGKAHEGSQWTLAVSKRKRETGEAAFKLFETLQAKAQEARNANASQDLKEIGDRITRWGIPEFVARFQKLVEE